MYITEGTKRLKARLTVTTRTLLLMQRKLSGLTCSFFFYANVIFFSYVLSHRFPNRSEARQLNVFNSGSPIPFSRSPSPFASPFGPYNPRQCLQSWSATQVPLQECLSEQEPTGPEKKQAFCLRFGVPSTNP